MNEAITKQISDTLATNGWFDEDSRITIEKQLEILSHKVAASLLTMKQDCPNELCEGGLIKGVFGKSPERDALCGDCHGTGKSPYNVIYEACQDQTPPNITINRSDDIANSYNTGYRQSQLEMLTPSMHNGRPTKWVKVYCE